MNIYLARHGQNEDNANGVLNGHRDLPLTELGREQALETGRRVKELGLKFNAVLASPLQRAFETAEIISSTSNNPRPKVEELLIERDFGAMSGVEQTKIKELCSPDIIETDTIIYFLSPEGAETFPELIKRGKDLLKKIRVEHKDNESVLLVSHGDFGKMLYAAYYNLDWKDVLLNFHFGNSEILLLSEDSSPEETHLVKIKQYNT